MVSSHVKGGEIDGSSPISGRVIRVEGWGRASNSLNGKTYVALRWCNIFIKSILRVIQYIFYEYINSTKRYVGLSLLLNLVLFKINFNEYEIQFKERGKEDKRNNFQLFLSFLFHF